MSISDSDLIEYLSSVAGSTGGAISGSSVVSGVPNNVNPNVLEAARLAGGTDYRLTYWKNTNGVDAAIKPVVFIPVFPLSETLLIGIGVGGANDTDTLQGNMTAWTAPAAVSLTSSTAGDVRLVTIFGMDNSGTPVPVTEVVTLTGTSEVLSVNVYSKVWSVSVGALDGARTVTVKQGAAGTVRGSIGPNKQVCWLWVSAGVSKGAGIALPNLAPNQAYAIWRKLSWIAGAATRRPNTQTIRIEENQ